MQLAASTNYLWQHFVCLGLYFWPLPRHSLSFWWDHHLEIGRRACIVAHHIPLFLCIWWYFNKHFTFNILSETSCISHHLEIGRRAHILANWLPLFLYLVSTTCPTPPCYHFALESEPGTWVGCGPVRQNSQEMQTPITLIWCSSIPLWILVYHWDLPCQGLGYWGLSCQVLSLTILGDILSKAREFSMSEKSFSSWTCCRNPFQLVFVTKTTPFVPRPSLICKWETLLTGRETQHPCLPGLNVRAETNCCELKVAICQAHLFEFLTRLTSKLMANCARIPLSNFGCQKLGHLQRQLWV